MSSTMKVQANDILEDIEKGFVNSDSFGARLNDAIKLKGASRKDVAELLDVSLSAISHYCHNKRKPSLEAIRSIAVYLQIPVGYFFGEVSLVEALKAQDDLQRERGNSATSVLTSGVGNRSGGGYIPVIEIQSVNGMVESLKDAKMKSYLSIPNKLINVKARQCFVISASKNAIVGLKNKKSIIIYEKPKYKNRIEHENNIHLLHIRERAGKVVNKLYLGRCVNIDNSVLLFDKDSNTNIVLSVEKDDFEVVGKAVLSWDYLN